MAVGTFTVGQWVQDIGTGRVGQLVNIMKNSIVPGLHQGVVRFGTTDELLYFTRLRAAQQPQELSLHDVLELLNEDAEAQAPEEVVLDLGGAPAAVMELVNVEDKPAPKKRGRPRKVQ